MVDINKKKIEPSISRKTFIKDSVESLINNFSQFLNHTAQITTRTKKYLRPPGAISEKEFVTKCDLCGKCQDACSQKSIKPADENGDKPIGSPIIFPEETPCYLCSPVICSTVCPKGALKPVKPPDVKIGKIFFKKETCFAFQGIDKDCKYCYYSCPLKDKAIKFDKWPVFIEEYCTGCGLCVYNCTSSPKSVEVISI